jgi:uncharacterized repeat protein (TIGR03943 family)
VNKVVQGWLLLLFATILLRLSTSDLLTRYVKPSARPWVLAAGIAILLCTLAELILTRRDRKAPGAKAAWLLCTPVAVVLLIAPPALGVYSADRAQRLAPTTTMSEHFDPLPGTGVHALKVTDFVLRVLWDQARTVTDKDVALTGFVLQQRPDGFVLARLVITCCAADARPIEVVVRTGAPPAVGTWLIATGRYTGIAPDSVNLPMLTANTVDVVQQPKNPYD